jgi:hypothetical protein
MVVFLETVTLVSLLHPANAISPILAVAIGVRCFIPQLVAIVSLLAGLSI